MSNFRTTADILDGVLARCGEITSDMNQGTSQWRTRALLYLNQIHHNIVMGGCELNVEVDEPWIWARSPFPLIIRANTGITNGTCALTYGSLAGTFSAAPTDPTGANISVQGWHLRPTGAPEIYKITQHTSGSTSFTLDAPFPQATNASLNFWLFQIDYDLIGQSLTIDQTNNKLDFVESGTTLVTATLTMGSYTPAGLATQVATALNAATTVSNTYTVTYNAVSRLFTVTSNLSGVGSIFTMRPTATNAQDSGWLTLGFDMLDQSAAASYTGTYPLFSIVRFTQAARIYYGGSTLMGDATGQVSLLDPVAFDRSFPLLDIRAGAPEQFCVIRDRNDGMLTVRFNRYPMNTGNVQSMRIEFEYIPTPIDLQDSAASVPLIPRKFIRILEYGAAFYLLKDKSDAKAQDYLQIAQEALASMIKVNRKELEKAGRNFGDIIARMDLMPGKRRRRLNNYGYTAEE